MRKLQFGNPRIQHVKKLLAVLILVPLFLALDGRPDRIESVATKLRCTCGCGEILAECSHLKCESKKTLKAELADAIQNGLSDEQIVQRMGARHGAAILLTPSFNGFNTALWIVPIVVIFLGFAFVVLQRFKSTRHRPDK